MSKRLGRGLDSLLGILDRDEEVAEILEVEESSKWAFCFLSTCHLFLLVSKQITNKNLRITIQE